MYHLGRPPKVLIETDVLGAVVALLDMQARDVLFVLIDPPEALHDERVVVGEELRVAGAGLRILVRQELVLEDNGAAASAAAVIDLVRGLVREAPADVRLRVAGDLGRHRAAASAGRVEPLDFLGAE